MGLAKIKKEIMEGFNIHSNRKKLFSSIVRDEFMENDLVSVTICKSIAMNFKQ